MRILHLPVNIASTLSHTVRGLRQSNAEIKVLGIVYGDNAYHSARDISVVHSASRRKIYPWLWKKMVFAYQVQNLIRGADVLHWYFGSPVLPAGLDLRYVNFLGKPGVVEWLGSEIRVPEVEFADNPYYRAAFSKGYEYSFENLRSSHKIQQRFASAGFASVVSAGMFQYLKVPLWKKIYTVPQRIVLSDYEPCYPDSNSSVPVIVHSPTAPIAKGTPAILAVVEKLSQKYEFEFQLVSNVTRAQALEIMQKADIFVDQVVIGHYGMAAIEAMAYGKPVVCYIKPSLVAQFPPDCPIVNASEDTLESVLEELIRSAQRRHATGLRSRRYVEKHHDAVKIGSQLLDIYRELMDEKNAKVL
jgi:hypothetical protein